MSALINTSKLSIYPSIINTQTPQAISPYFTSVIKTPTFKHIISASFNTMILLSEFSQNFSAESNCYISARTPSTPSLRASVRCRQCLPARRMYFCPSILPLRGGGVGGVRYHAPRHVPQPSSDFSTRDEEYCFRRQDCWEKAKRWKFVDD